ncbi:MAG: NrfD/PsrC family molybdoenzyme membrane anchor subunit [Acidimicrobiia bacterium]
MSMDVMVEKDRASEPDEVPAGRRAAVLRPLGRPSPRYLIVLGAALIALLWFVQAWVFQLRHGLVVTNLSDWGTGGGVPWGLYVGSFIWWVGIAHGGIVVSAAVRLFGLDGLKPVARLAELLTLAALANAGLYIILHVGRPDRIVTSILPNLGQTIRSSPLAWDVVVITLYFVLTATYLALTIRHDLFEVRNRLPGAFAPLYRAVLVGYRPEERPKSERMAWWLALGVIVLAPLFLHGGVIPWLFALLPGQPAWFGPAQGPQFLAAALSSALAAVTILAYVFRRVYRWEEIIPDRVFDGLSRWTGLFALLYLWLQLQQVITGAAMAPDAVGSAIAAKVGSPLFWFAMTLLALTVGHSGAQALSPRLFSVGRTAAVAVLPVLAILIEKTLFVIEGLMHPAFTLYEGMPSTYTPSWVELSSVIGALAIVVLFFLGAAKALPLVELGEGER